MASANSKAIPRLVAALAVWGRPGGDGAVARVEVLELHSIPRVTTNIEAMGGDVVDMRNKGFTRATISSMGVDSELYSQGWGSKKERQVGLHCSFGLRWCWQEMIVELVDLMRKRMMVMVIPYSRLLETEYLYFVVACQ